MTQTIKAVTTTGAGGPESLAVVERPRPEAGPGETLLHLSRIGVNFVDIYQRKGVYAVPPGTTLGFEAAGTAPDGKRYAFIDYHGAYAEYAAVPTDKLFALPDALDDDGAMALFQGVTAQYLSSAVHPIRDGETALVYAAAGGVGSLLVQMIRARGGRPIGIVSSEDKAKPVRALGCEAIVARDGDPAAVRALVPDGVDVAYDANGAATWEATLESVRARGHIVLYGAAGGPIPPVNLSVLLQHRSLSVTYSSVFDHIADPRERAERVADVLAMLDRRTIVPFAATTFPLAEAARAHAFLESRASTGKVLLAV